MAGKKNLAGESASILTRTGWIHNLFSWYGQRPSSAPLILLVLPALLELLGINAENYFSLMPLLNANRILNGFLNTDNILYGAAYGIVAVILIAGCRQYLRKRHREGDFG
ncbi:MAG: hypothetical protein LUC32_04965 [Clostridiales bacterium]|nr:hypothetical protein [Clostridiales bacterium]